MQRSPRGGIVREARRPPGWVAPGPRPAGADDRADLEPGPGEDLCHLTGDWRLLQLIGGHRWSLDDLVTAWVAAGALAGPPARTLDLGCGIGSVLLMVAWRFPAATCLGVEAQPRSAALARRSIAWNGASDRVTVWDGDLRALDVPLMADDGTRGGFDLVTGTPPYFPRGEGVESDDAQRAPCRFEHRGGVEDYCLAAARTVAPGAPFVMCAAALEHERVVAGAAAAGLRISARLDVVPRAGKAPLIGIYTLHAARHAGATTATIVSAATLTVRDAHGQWTPEFQRVRGDMGLPPRT